MMLIIVAVIVHLLTFVKCLRCNQVHIKLQNLLNNLNNGCRTHRAMCIDRRTRESEWMNKKERMK